LDRGATRRVGRKTPRCTEAPADGSPWDSVHGPVFDGVEQRRSLACTWVLVVAPARLGVDDDGERA